MKVSLPKQLASGSSRVLSASRAQAVRQAATQNRRLVAGAAPVTSGILGGARGRDAFSRRSELRSALALAPGEAVMTASTGRNRGVQRREMSTDAGGGKPLFDKILIANRGEIACRIARTARKMGIKTVAVYSEADARAVHVQACDEAVCVGPAPSIDSYLNVDRIIMAMKATGAQAVHPGYGFLSENASFVTRLEKEGLVFIGPGEFAMESMGDKIASKLLAEKAGVNVIPGYNGIIKDEAEAVKVSNDIGYPVMIKASAGGGGKGMRIAWNDQDAAEGFRLSSAEAAASFGDDRIFVEKFVEKPRHIEIQIIADTHGNVIYLPERDCSVQRRNQKVVEEAPSKFIEEATWRAMGEQAVQLAKAVNYRSAGTVEMMVDKDKNFYFLEMNTRLQVEHPVTEMVTGLDLVELMIKVAAGEKLPFTQDSIKAKGHAMEVRVYAEDPLRGFLPAIGKLSRYVLPDTETGKDTIVRVDTGVEEGSEISIFYDPMIAKLITYGPDRNAAIAAMRKALDAYIIRGVVCNINFVRDVMDNDKFLAGDVTTNFIAENYPSPPGFQGHKLTESEGRELCAIASILHMQHAQQAKILLPPEGSYVAGKQTVGRAALVGVMSPNNVMGDADLVVEINGAGMDAPLNIPLSVAAMRPKLGDVISTSFEVRMDGAPSLKMNANLPSVAGLYEVSYKQLNEDEDAAPLGAVLADTERVVQVWSKSSQGYTLSVSGTQYKVTIRTPRVAELAKFMPVQQEEDHSKTLRSPMPGKVHSIAVQEGEHVRVGQELCVVEAMKMQNVLRCEKDSIVAKIPVSVGQSVAVDEVILEFAEPEAPPTGT
uniref:Propionyl-CoA carboxylase alpha chain, mitochondrial n=2 Tax=Hemiselmis andersenii TaxID=464988 RepID=A0A7S1ECZ6_HEMAN|mmetsp:Transcript_4499/g.10872  ORF Transcript_4499/g.10872 Transcript_4499/m.10872 type:complete len:827 (+) Transcript_4499:48-2528(+)